MLILDLKFGGYYHHLTGIYLNSFANARFRTKIELLQNGGGGVEVL